MGCGLLILPSVKPHQGVLIWQNRLSIAHSLSLHGEVTLSNLFTEENFLADSDRLVLCWLSILSMLYTLAAAPAQVLFLSGWGTLVLYTWRVQSLKLHYCIALLWNLLLLGCFCLFGLVWFDCKANWTGLQIQRWL